MKIALSRRWLSVLAAMFSIAVTNLLPGQTSTPSSTEPAKAAITALLNDFLKFNRDPAQHDRFWADDLIYTNNAGKVKTKPEIMKGLAEAAKASMSKPAEPASVYSAEDTLIRVYGETAALTFRLVARSPDGTVAYFRNSGTLLHRNGTWQVITWQATRELTPAK